MKATIGIAGFLLAAGSVGGIEYDTISLTQGLMQSLFGVGLFYLGTRGWKNDRNNANTGTKNTHNDDEG